MQSVLMRTIFSVLFCTVMSLTVVAAERVSPANSFSELDASRIQVLENSFSKDRLESLYQSETMDLTQYDGEKLRITQENTDLARKIVEFEDQMNPARMQLSTSYSAKLRDAQSRLNRNLRTQKEWKSKLDASETPYRRYCKEMTLLLREEESIHYDIDRLKWQSVNRTAGEYYDLQQKLWDAKYVQYKNQQELKAISTALQNGVLQRDTYDQMRKQLQMQETQYKNRVAECEKLLGNRETEFAVSENLFTDYYAVVSEMEKIQMRLNKLEWRYEDGRTPFEEYRKTKQNLQEQYEILLKQKRAFGKIES